MSKQEDDQLQLALEKFENIMNVRAEKFRRLATRVRTVVRGGMMMLVMIGVALSLLLWMLATRMHHTEKSLLLMQQYVQSVQHDMRDIRKVISVMEQRMYLMQPISQNISAIGANTDNMSQDMTDLSQAMADINQRMVSVEGRLRNISNSVGHVGHSVNGMNYNVRQMSRPTKMFNWMPLP